MEPAIHAGPERPASRHPYATFSTMEMFSTLGAKYIQGRTRCWPGSFKDKGRTDSWALGLLTFRLLNLSRSRGLASAGRSVFSVIVLTGQDKAVAITGQLSNDR